ncbi:SDR family oxidoreductase [Thermaerobacter subterraneus]|uniref:Short-chain alcohol dehydrogenase n=1 Tax=Thermaerobacter subterraneus DSM 13965 TaxID=867903 RepID=K6QD27_9FIRM|nr:SDR family NAD(P)-dependent oxidoreductase [Thermaerobacter subterraneus]EKP94501.1 short-chain alcohol dehydrogenase [Thermaerobacter subterraneus DSM 13965]
MPERELSGQVWVITGGAGAIAGSVARAFAAAGARLVLADVAGAALEARARELGAEFVPVDLTRAGEAEGLARQVQARMGRIDGLIHTVGTYAGGRVHEVDPAQYDRLFDLNVRTLFYCVRAVLPVMLEQEEGFIAGFASGPAWRGAGPRAALYAAAKGAVATFLQSLDEELREGQPPGSGGAPPSRGRIRVAVVYPMGVVDTPANRKAMPGADPAGWIDPGEIAAALLFAATRGPGGRLLELPVYPGR